MRFCIRFILNEDALLTDVKKKFQTLKFVLVVDIFVQMSNQSRTCSPNDDRTIKILRILLHSFLSHCSFFQMLNISF